MTELTPNELRFFSTMVDDRVAKWEEKAASVLCNLTSSQRHDFVEQTNWEKDLFGDPNIDIPIKGPFLKRLVPCNLIYFFAEKVNVETANLLHFAMERSEVIRDLVELIFRASNKYIERHEAKFGRPRGWRCWKDDKRDIKLYNILMGSEAEQTAL